MPTKQRRAYSARIEKALVVYDGPQLLLLRSDRGLPMLAHAVDIPGYQYPLFAAEIIDRYVDLYQRGRVDLLFVFKSTPKSRLYLADLTDSEVVSLHHPRGSQWDQDIWPEPGIFSSVHTDTAKTDKRDVQRFSIDGIWEARDFSSFHGKMADAYSLVSIARRLGEPVTNALELRFLQSTIDDKPWQGGGSYLSFYGNVKNHQNSVHPLTVAGIEYHSPGYVDMAGRREVLDEIIDAIGVVIGDYSDLTTLYRAIRKTLRAEGLLTSDRDGSFSSSSVENYVERQSLLLASRLKMPQPETVLAACGGNVAVFAKLILSYFRRVRGLSLFYVEGRVRTG